MTGHWKTLGPKLSGKLHVAAGEMDNYYLNNAVHLLDDYLSQAHPSFKIKIVYGPGKRHGWFDLSLRETLEEMAVRTAATR
jgi:dienelactone hydrolase